MGTQAFAIVPPAHCRPFSLLGTQKPSLRYASPCCLRCSPRVVAFQGTAGDPFQPAQPLSSASWPWSAHRSDTSAPFSSMTTPTTGSTSVVTRCLALLLYRALLLGGIAFGFVRTTAAHAAPPASETVVREASGANQQVKEGLEKAQGKQSENVLGEEFWKGLDLARGSAELILKKVLDSDPTNLSALECLAKTLIDDDDIPRALLILEKLEGLQPGEMEWKYMKAEAYDLDGKANLAKKIFEDILKVEPFSSRALKGLVLAMDQLDEGDAALKILEDTWNKAKQENNREEANNFGILIGQIHTFKGRMQEALQHYKKMVDEDASDFRLYLCQGIIYSVLGEVDTADKMFETFEKLCPKDLRERGFYEQLRSRARKEGQKVFEFKQKQNAISGKKGGKTS